MKIYIFLKTQNSFIATLFRTNQTAKKLINKVLLTFSGW